MTRTPFVRSTAIAAALLVSAFTLSAVAEAAPKTAAGISIPVAGTGSGASLTGTFNLQRFAVINGVVNAIGTVTGTVTNAAGGVTSIVRNIAVPITVGQTSCDILHLELGPLFLDLLGLQINLNQIVLDIDAQAGPGNLLGNLLCAVAGLLDNPNGLANLLNRILAALV